MVWVRHGLKSGYLENRPPAQPECWWPMGRRTQSGESGKEKKTRSVLVRWPPLHGDTGGPLPMPCAWADDAEPSCLADRPVGGDGGMENKSPARPPVRFPLSLPVCPAAQPVSLTCWIVSVGHWETAAWRVNPVVNWWGSRRALAAGLGQGRAAARGLGARGGLGPPEESVPGRGQSLCALRVEDPTSSRAEASEEA